MKSTTLALIGTGNWGSKIYKDSLSLKGIKIKYLCSPNILGKKLQGSYIPVADYKELVKFEDISGIIIAAPPKLHPEISRFFIQRNFGLLVEKPFALSAKEAKTIEKLVNEKKSLFKIGYIYLFCNFFKEAKTAITTFHKLEKVEIRLGNVNKRHNQEILWGWGSHAYSLALSLIGASPKSLYGKYTKDLEGVELNLTYNKFQVFVEIGFNFEKRTREIILYGDGRKSRLKEIAGGDLTSSITPIQNEILNFCRLLRNKNKISKSDLKLGLKVTELLEKSEEALSSGKEIQIHG
jgi:predicted dehydrogenase